MKKVGRKANPSPYPITRSRPAQSASPSKVTGHLEPPAARPRLSLENAPQIPLYPPFLEGDLMIPLFGKEGLGEIFIPRCDGRPSWGFHL